jgi:hypothetical protein
LAVDEGWIGDGARLTQAGRRELSKRLGIDVLPQVKTWLAVQRSVLARLVLGMTPATGKSDFAADVICATHALEPCSTLRAAVDRLAWRAVGLETDAKFDALAVQRHLLREIVPNDRKLEPRKFRQLVAARSLQLQVADNDRLRHSAVRRWVVGMKLCDSRVVVQASRGLVVTENDNTNRGETSIERFATAVVDAARQPGVSRFHDDRAFIGSIWEHMRGREPVFDMSLDTFKDRLVQAHRQKLLRMSRADLVQAMDPAEVERSEARYLSATFHFVGLQAGGAR